MIDVIVSLTSHGCRLKNEIVTKAIYSIISGSYKPQKIILTLFKDDLKYINKNLKLMIDTDIVELIIANQDLGPHLKYFYAMQKYKDYPIITIDDDNLYDSNLIERLVKSYELNKNFISANRCHLIKFKENTIDSYSNWQHQYTKIINIPNKFLFATGVGGVIYPPNIFNISESNIPDILKCKYADDIYLKVLAIRNNTSIINITSDYNLIHPKLLVDNTSDDSLFIQNRLHNRNDTYINIFSEDFKLLLK